jgi:hypothetical protein
MATVTTPKLPAGKKNPFETKIFKAETAKLARAWFREKIKNLSSTTIKETSTSDLRYRGDLPLIGRMVYYQYRAKYEKTLPYWDRFPLTIMIDETPTHYLGLNLHYLPPSLRGVFLGRLMEVITNERFDKTTKLKISYDILKSASKYSYFKPCIKSYIKKNIKSKIMIIRPSMWHMAIMLPSARFVGASASEVWSDSKSSYTGKK